MEIILIFLSIVIIALLVFMISLISRSSRKNTDYRAIADMIKNDNAASNRALREEVSANIQSSVNSLGNMLNMAQKNSGDAQSRRIDDMSTQINAKLSDMDKFLSQKQAASSAAVNEQLKVLENRFKTLEANNELKLEAIRSTMTKHLTSIQDENSKKLDAIQTTVNEKLESKMNESFKLVSERLEQVYKGLGEMQTIASGVGDLKKVLSNVKTRGILGEIQLSAILEQVLTKEQYDENVATKKGSSDRVEFAIRLPGDEDGVVYLPIDAKFPADKYSNLADAYETGDKAQIEACGRALEASIKASAKYIHDKYVDPPATTDFAILFLPFEGLYAEVVRRGMVEVLQREYKVNIAGPTTMAALLNSLQMGFRTLAIEKHSSRVWDVLGAVKTEFGKFEKTLKKAQERINQANNELDALIGTRTNVIQRRLRDVTALPEETSSGLLGINDNEE